MSKSNFIILVSGSPTQSQAHLSAIRFIKAAMKMHHTINQVFFYQEAVLVANRLISKPSDELQLTQEWVTLSQLHGFELQVCIGASSRRGVVSQDCNDQDCNDQDCDDQYRHDNLFPGYEILGLGQFAAALSQQNHPLIQFK